MLALSFIREQPDLVRQGAYLKGEQAPVDEILKLDAERRTRLQDLERKKAEQNQRSKELARSRDEAAMEEMRRLRQEIKAIEQELGPIDARLNMLLLEVPNPPDTSVPHGTDSSANPLIREWGLDRKPAFAVKPHYEIGERLGILDFERGVKVATSRFYFLKGAGARLERALINFMIDLHIREHEYTELFPPFLLNRAAMTGTGQLPKFEEDAFRIEKKDLFLVPTAEVPVTNMYRDEILALGGFDDALHADAASGHYALVVMTVVALLLLPVVLAYQGWSFHVFRHRVAAPEAPPREAAGASGATPSPQ